MINLLQSFAGGLCFALGTFVGIVVCSWAIMAKDKAKNELQDKISKRIEDRMETQVKTMVAYLEEIKKNKTS